MKPITDPDLTRTDKEYWEMVLKSHGLGMNRGVTQVKSAEEEIKRTRTHDLIVDLQETETSE